VGTPIGAALLPKCPFCFLALASFLNAVGIEASTYSQVLLPVLVVLLSIPILLLGFYRTGSARIRTIVLMFGGAGFLIFGRLEDWQIAFQLSSGGMYCLGALWKSHEKPCCANTHEIVHASKTAMS
jgi:hypothetical protein